MVPVGLIVLCTAIGIGSRGNDTTTAATPAGLSSPFVAAPTTFPAGEETSAEPTEQPAADPTEKPAPTNKAQPRKAPPTKKAMSDEQLDAVGSAKSYLEFTAFSRKGLIDQLSLDAGDDFSKKDATIAVDFMHIDFKKQAVKSAESYRQFTHFSRSGLIHELQSSKGDGYTHKQAVYGADHSR